MWNLHVCACLCFVKVRPLQHAPVGLANFIRSNVIYAATPFHGSRCLWSKVDDTMTAFVVRKYFNVDTKFLSCELFLIEGVPAACMLYKENTSGQLDVKEFHINESILLMFDAGLPMRKLLRKRYKKIDLSRALNRDKFLLI